MKNKIDFGFGSFACNSRGKEPSHFLNVGLSLLPPSTVLTRNRRILRLKPGFGLSHQTSPYHTVGSYGSTRLSRRILVGSYGYECPEENLREYCIKQTPACIASLDPLA